MGASSRVSCVGSGAFSDVMMMSEEDIQSLVSVRGWSADFDRLQERNVRFGREGETSVCYNCCKSLKAITSYRYLSY